MRLSFVTAIFNPDNMGIPINKGRGMAREALANSLIHQEYIE